MEEMKLWQLMLGADFVMRYDAGILKRNANELKSLNRNTRNFMTIHEALHPKSVVDRIVGKWEEGD